MTPSPVLLEADQHLKPALDYILEKDPDFAKALPLIQPLPDRSQPAGFQYLTKIIVEQQVSLASANAIWRRMSAAITPFSPARLLNFTEDQLRALGLSKQKAVYCRALAHDIQSKTLSLESLPDMTDAKAMETLMQVKGIGRWTAEIYLLSCLNRQDIWPAGDVALKTALQHLKDLPKRPSVEEMDDLIAPLRPHRTLVARILWRYYADVVRKK